MPLFAAVCLNEGTFYAAVEEEYVNMGLDKLFKRKMPMSITL